MKINTIKNIAILLDFLISMVASMIQKSNSSLSGILFGISAIILFIAVICVIIEIIKTKKI